MPRTVPLLTCLILLALAPAASAGWFPAEPLDGPAPIDRVAVDVGHEDTGAVVYIKGGQAWTSVLAAGAWGAPAAISGPGTSEAVVAAGVRGRVAVAWIENGTVLGALLGSPAVTLSAPGGASGLAIDMGINGVAYAVWSQGGDVRAARLEGGAWQAVAAPLDIDAADRAGEGTARPRVAVAADGSAIVTWGEARGDGRTHVFVRRIYGTTPSSIPQDATPDSIDGVAAGSADLPELDVEYDRSFAWVAFRQEAGGRTRSVARRLRASTFEPPVTIDMGATSGEPRIALSGSGEGHGVAVTADGAVVGAALRNDAFQAPARVDAFGMASEPRVTFSERDDAAVVWRAGADPSAVVRARMAPEEGPFGGEAVLSRPDLGSVPAGGFAVASNRVADVAVAMLQGAPGARYLAIAMHDLPPSRPVLTAPRSYGPLRPLIEWNAGLDLMGPQTFKVLIDGREVATTAKTSLRAPRRLRAGMHRVQVIGVDRRGQASTLSRSRRVRVDGGIPRMSVRTQRTGRRVRVRVEARDPRGGTGIRGVRVDWGDDTKASRGTTTAHRYRRGGRYKIMVIVSDRAGNQAIRTVTVRV
jgi:PKD domain